MGARRLDGGGEPKTVTICRSQARAQDLGAGDRSQQIGFLLDGEIGTRRSAGNLARQAAAEISVLALI